MIDNWEKVNALSPDVRGNWEKVNAHSPNVRGNWEKVNAHSPNVRDNWEKVNALSPDVNGNGDKVKGSGDEVNAFSPDVNSNGDRSSEFTLERGSKITQPRTAGRLAAGEPAVEAQPYQFVEAEAFFKVRTSPNHHFILLVEIRIEWLSFFGAGIYAFQ